MTGDLTPLLDQTWAFTMWEDEGRFFMRVNGLSCGAHGASPDEAYRNVRQALAEHVRQREESGRPLPAQPISA